MLSINIWRSSLTERSSDWARPVRRRGCSQLYVAPNHTESIAAIPSQKLARMVCELIIIEQLLNQ
jgi:hypothetical protein